MIKHFKRPHPHSDTYSDSDSKIDEISTDFPSYLVLELVEDKPIRQLSPFIIERFLSANVTPKSVKATRNKILIVEVKKEICRTTVKN